MYTLPRPFCFLCLTVRRSTACLWVSQETREQRHSHEDTEAPGELSGVLSNPLATAQLARLAEALSGSGEPAARRSSAIGLRRRQGEVLRAIRQVLADRPDGLVDASVSDAAQAARARG